MELNNPTHALAMQIQTMDYYMIGWAPRYLAPDLAAVTAPNALEVKVVQVNPMPAPSSQRVLVELRGKWTEHEPMSGEDYQPLVGEP